MERVIHLRGDVVTLYEDKLLIEDGSAKQKKLRLITAFIWLIYTGGNIWSYLNDGEDYRPFLMAIGVFLSLFYFRWLWLSDAREILLEEVKMVKFRTFAIGTEYLEIRLKNGLRRLVRNIDIVADELQKYFAERGL